MEAVPGFITVHTYATQMHPKSKKRVHPARVLNISHIVAVEEHFYTDRNLDLKTVCAGMVKMFGQEPTGTKETVGEISTKIAAAHEAAREAAVLG